MCKMHKNHKFCSPTPAGEQPERGVVIRYHQTLRLVKCLRLMVRVYEIARFCPPLTYSGGLRRVFKHLSATHNQTLHTEDGSIDARAERT